MAILVQDTFTAVDGTYIDARLPDVGGAWSDGPGATVSVPRIYSNTARLLHSAAECSSAINATIVPANCYVQLDVLTAPLISRLILFSARVNGSGANFTGYQVVLGDSRIAIRRFDNSNEGSYGIGTVLAEISRDPIIATYKLTINGSDLTLYEDGVSIATATDATYSGTGQVHFSGINISTQHFIDNFEAGDYVAPSTPSSPLPCFRTNFIMP